MAKNNDAPLTREEVESVIEFARGLAIGDRYGWYTPDLSNALLRNLNNNAKVPTLEAIRKALENYKDNEDNLQAFTEFAAMWDMIFSRTLQSYVNSLAIDLSYVPTNAYTAADYASPEYEEDRRRIEKFLNKFDYKSAFKNVAREVMLHETYYTWFRRQKWGSKGDMKYALQVLPQDRCKITGYFEHGMLFDFDMSYFLMAGTDIDAYDPVFKKYYNTLFGEGGMYQNYRPTNQFNNRTGTFAMWTQTSPAEGAFCFKLFPNNFAAVPFLAPYLKAAITNDEIQQLQRDKDIAEAYAILAGEIETYANAKSGTQADQFAINPKTLGAFISKAKAGLGSIKVAAMPLKNLEWYQFQNQNEDMYKMQLQTSAATGTGLSRIIYSTDRMSNAEIEGAQNETFRLMEPLYYQFGQFMDFFANQVCKKYRFKFTFSGSTYQWQRNANFDKLMKMADKGIVLDPTQYAAALGIQPQIFEASLRTSKYTGWVEQFSTLLANANTATGVGGKDSGRPQSDDSELSDSGEYNRNQ